MGRACEELGFFRIPLTAVSREVADAAWDAAAEFFALPAEEKRRVEFPEPGYPYGYSPFAAETLARSVGTDIPLRPDLKESLSVGPDCAATQPLDLDDVWVRAPSLWPDRPSHLRHAWTAYYQELSTVAEHLMSVMAVALDLAPDYFVSMIDRPITSMRAIHYPEAPKTQRRDGLRAGAHTDYGTLTILRTDDVPGLEIHSSDGAWVPVAPEPDTLIVNLGDSIAQWTNDRWPSTMHRVTAPNPDARQSFAFFHMANWDATIECLPTCRIDGREPRHPPVQAGPWLMRKFQSTVM